MWWLIGFVGWLMVFYGVWLLGNKDIRGFYWNLSAEALLIFDAILFGHFSLIFSCLVFSTLNIINIIKWKRDSLDIETKFFEDHPQMTMSVWKSNSGIDIEISHDTHAFPDAYVSSGVTEYKGKTEQELRKIVVQKAIDNLD